MTLRRRLTNIPLLLSLGLALTHLWVSSPAQSRLAGLQAALPPMLDSAGIPGVSIALIENGRVS